MLMRDLIDRSLVNDRHENSAAVSSLAFTADLDKAPDRPDRHSGAYSVRSLLEWAFGVELARLDLDDLPQRAGKGIEAVLLDRAMLGGVEIDISRGHSRPADDAEIIADVVASELHPKLAITVAEYARAGRVPDWMPGARPHVEPREWRRCKHGMRAKVERCGTVRWVVRGREYSRDIFWCPITYTPSPKQIADARRHYLDWWGALLRLRMALVWAGMSHHTVTGAMPPGQPWREIA